MSDGVARQIMSELNAVTTSEPTLTKNGRVLSEQKIGVVIKVQVPKGVIQLEGMDTTIPYHYSDVWDDGKCVKQFPRVGDTVTFHTSIDTRTKTEKAEMVKVKAKKPASANVSAQKDVAATILQAHERTQMNQAAASHKMKIPGQPLPVPATPTNNKKTSPTSSQGPTVHQQLQHLQALHQNQQAQKAIPQQQVLQSATLVKGPSGQTMLVPAVLSGQGPVQYVVMPEHLKTYQQPQPQYAVGVPCTAGVKSDNVTSSVAQLQQFLLHSHARGYGGPQYTVVQMEPPQLTVTAPLSHTISPPRIPKGFDHLFVPTSPHDVVISTAPPSPVEVTTATPVPMKYVPCSAPATPAAGFSLTPVRRIHFSPEPIKTREFSFPQAMATQLFTAEDDKERA